MAAAAAAASRRGPRRRASRGTYAAAAAAAVEFDEVSGACYLSYVLLRGAPSVPFATLAASFSHTVDVGDLGVADSVVRMRHRHQRSRLRTSVASPPIVVDRRARGAGGDAPAPRRRRRRRRRRRPTRRRAQPRHRTRRAWRVAGVDAALHICWALPGFVDAESGLDGVAWQLLRLDVSGSGADSVVDYGEIDGAAATAASAAAELVLPLSTALLSGRHYSVVLAARNRAGLLGANVTSTAVGVDDSPPEVAGATVGLCEPGVAAGCAAGWAASSLPRLQGDTARVRVAWSGFSDTQSGIANCSVALHR